MSFKSWCEEHYPVSAQYIATSHHEGKVPMTAVIQHSVDKWKGLRKINTKKHEILTTVNFFGSAVVHAEGSFGDPCNRLTYAGGSCSLCAVSEGDCTKCPIKITSGATCISVYEFVDPNIPDTVEDMISLLEETLEKTKAGVIHPNSKEG